MGGNAPLSDRRVGERMVEDEVVWLGNKARQLLDEYTELQPQHRMVTFEDVERVWHEVVEPRFAQLETMQDVWNGQKPVPPDSNWSKNSHIPDNWR